MLRDTGANEQPERLDPTEENTMGLGNNQGPESQVYRYSSATS